MKNVRIISILGFLLLFTSCRRDENEIKERTRLSNEISFMAAKELCQSYNAEIIGFGGSTLDGVRDFDISLAVDNTFTIEEARRVIVSCEEILLRHINSSNEIRQFLVVYPFTVARATVSISSKTYPKDRPDIISHITISREVIRYDSRDENGRYKEVHSEPYEYALKKVSKDLQLRG